MGDRSAIEWTDATWNPVRGCSIVSKGCTNCYAMRQAHRSSGSGGAYEGLTKATRGGPVWTGEIRLMPELLDQPLCWVSPRRIFVNSMSDLFHEGVPFEFIDKIFAVMTACDRHVFQILTKRPRRMLEWFARLTPDRLFGMEAGPEEVTEQRVKHFHARPLRGNRGGYDNCGLDWPARNIWLGVSVEDQAAADERIPLLLATPAAVRWISAEPLLGAIDLSRYLGTPLPKPYPFLISVLDQAPRGLDWVVAGGESGPSARPMHPDWARSLRDQCTDFNVPFFFKQWGSWTPYCSPFVAARELNLGDVILRRAPKKSAGRMLDGRLHSEYPA